MSGTQSASSQVSLKYRLVAAVPLTFLLTQLVAFTLLQTRGVITGHEPLRPEVFMFITAWLLAAPLILGLVYKAPGITVMLYRSGWITGICVALVGVVYPVAFRESVGHNNEDFLAFSFLFAVACFVLPFAFRVAMRVIKKNVPSLTLTPEPMRKCPYCAELIKKDAVVCRFCNRDLEPAQPKETSADA